MTTTRTPSTLAREYESDERQHKLSTQLQAMMMVGSLFCYCFATSIVLLSAFALVPFLPILGRAYSALLSLFTPATCESGYNFVIQAPAGGLALAAQHLSSFLSAVTPSIGSSVRNSVRSSVRSSVRGSVRGSSSVGSNTSMGSGFLSSLSSYAASQPAPALVLPAAQSVVGYLYNEPAVMQLQSYRTECGGPLVH